jgi:uncharacterized protein YkwD
MRKLVPVFLLLTLFVSFYARLKSAQAHPASAPDLSTAYEVIDEVNAFRASYGLAPLTINSILMGIAQTQAEYILSIGSITHIDAYGRRPFQRALDAGYPVAGDLSQGGWFGEIIMAGAGMTAQEAVEWWSNSPPHLDVMTSTAYQDIGAGVAVSGNTYYYVVNAGLSTGGTPRPYTPPPYVVYPTPIQATNTPNPDGSVIYVVQPGDTLLGIAIAYDVSLDLLYALNGLTENSVIYAEQEIVIQSAYTATPTQPTPTDTLRPTSTLWPTSEQTSPATDSTPTNTPEPDLPSMPAGGAVIGIIIAALLAAGIITLVGAKKKLN